MPKASFDEIITRGEMSIHRTITINSIKKTSDLKRELTRSMGKQLETLLLPVGTLKYIKGSPEEYYVYRPEKVVIKRYHTTDKQFKIWIPERIFHLKIMGNSATIREHFLIGNQLNVPAFPNYYRDGKHCLGTTNILNGETSSEMVSNHILALENGSTVHNNDLSSTAEAGMLHLGIRTHSIVDYFDKLQSLTKEGRFVKMKETYQSTDSITNLLPKDILTHAIKVFRRMQ